MRRRPALPDCTARPTGRTAQPPAACTKPLNGPCGQGALLVAQATKSLNGPCGQGALLVAQATATHIPCELWLHYCIEKYAPRTYVGRGGHATTLSSPPSPPCLLSNLMSFHSAPDPYNSDPYNFVTGPLVCVECLIGKQKKPILFKVTEPSSIPYGIRYRSNTVCDLE